MGTPKANWRIRAIVEVLGDVIVQAHDEEGALLAFVEGDFVLDHTTVEFNDWRRAKAAKPRKVGD